ncbi:MAG: hypothetical protein ACI4MG_11870 [Aristaeellaceae bacterium]
MKKFLAMLLAVLMMALPFAGLAEEDLSAQLSAELNAMLAEMKAQYEALPATDYTQKALDAGRRIDSTVSLDWLAEGLTGDADTDATIAELIDSLSLTAYQQGDEIYYALGLKQADGTVANLLTFGYASEGDEHFLTTNLLGSSTIAVKVDDLQPVAERLLDMLALAGMLEQSDVDDIKASLPEMKEMLASYADMMTAEMAMLSADLFSMNYDAMIDVTLILAAKAQPVEDFVQPKNCDAAVAAVRFELNGEDMAAIMKSVVKFIQDNPSLRDYFDKYISYANSMMVSDEPMTFDALMDEMMAEMEAEAIELEESLVYTIAVNEAGMPVYGVMTLDDATVMTYTCLTMNDGPHYTVVFGSEEKNGTLEIFATESDAAISLAFAENGECVMSIDMVITSRSAENPVAFDLVITFDAPSAGMNLVVKASEDVTLNGVDFTQKEAVTITLNGMDLLAIIAETNTADPGASIKDGNVVRPAQLSDAEFANWFVECYNGLTTWAFSLMMALPASVQNMMMGM